MAAFPSSLYSYEFIPQRLASEVSQARQGFEAAPSSLGALSNLARYLQFPQMNFDSFYSRARDIIEGRALQNFPGALLRLRPLSEDYVKTLGLVRQSLMTWNPLNDVDGLKDSVEPLAIAHTEFAQAYNREIYALFPGDPEIILSQQKEALTLFCTALSAQLERISPELFASWEADAETIGGDLLPIFPRLAILHLLETPGYPVTEPFKEQSDEIIALRLLHTKLTAKDKEELLKAIRGEKDHLSADAQEIFNLHTKLTAKDKEEFLKAIRGEETPLSAAAQEIFNLHTKLTAKDKEELLKAIRGEETPLSAVAQEIFNRIGNIHYQLKNEKKAILDGIVQILYQEVRKSFSLLEKMKGMESFPGIRRPERALRRVFLSLLKQPSITDENGAISPDLVPRELCSPELKNAVLNFFNNYHKLEQHEMANFDRQFLKCSQGYKVQDKKIYHLLRDWSDLLFSWGGNMRLTTTLYAKLPRIREIRDLNDMRYRYTN